MVIEPDVKDWTWVLHRSCPECGFDARIVAPRDVAGEVRANAAAWVIVLRRDDVRRCSRPDRWSPLEYGCHVRDVCSVYLERLHAMLTSDDPLFANWDQDATALERRYGDQDPATVAEELHASSAALADRLDALGEDDWSRTGRRSDGATFTVGSLVRYMLHDLVHHLWDVGASG